MSQTTSVLLPSGQQLFTRVAYTSKEQAGVTFLVFVSILSLIAVIGLLGIISLSAFRTRSYRREEYLFVRTPVAAYFVSLLCCELIQAIGSLNNSRWVRLGAVQLDQSCTTQAILKQAGDVGTAIWSLAIALHTFSVLALEVELTSKLTSFGTLIAGWSGICAIVICGPAVVNTAQRGPFFWDSGILVLNIKWISDLSTNFGLSIYVNGDTLLFHHQSPGLSTPTRIHGIERMAYVILQACTGKTYQSSR